MELKERMCSRCKEKLPIENFYKLNSTKHKYFTYCKKCTSERRKTENPYNYEKTRISYLKNKYKMTEEDLNNLFLFQKKKCAICEKEHEFAYKRNGLNIDHCHKTGKVRGLLCITCNTLLGKAKDDVNLLLRAIKYLKK